MALFVLPEQSTAAGVTQLLIFIPEASWAVWVSRRVAQLARTDMG
ncbi:MAG TPA: hypothetical protein VMS99_01385 [Acidimicrobiia bacterium]|nr:hypothetical protein [Acidimicrobiia bacterium]